MNSAEKKWTVPPSVADIVYGVVRDYSRRCEALSSSIVSDESKEIFYKLNGAVESSLLMIEDASRGIFIYDMAHKVGYYHSKAMEIMNHKAYHLRKRKLIYSIAKMLNLV